MERCQLKPSHKVKVKHLIARYFGNRVKIGLDLTMMGRIMLTP